jgi:hypothetical protein
MSSVPGQVDQYPRDNYMYHLPRSEISHRLSRNVREWTRISSSCANRVLVNRTPDNSEPDLASKSTISIKIHTLSEFLDFFFVAAMA